MDFLYRRLNHSKSFDGSNCFLLHSINIWDQVCQSRANGAQGQKSNGRKHPGKRILVDNNSQEYREHDIRMNDDLRAKRRAHQSAC